MRSGCRSITVPIWLWRSFPFKAFRFRIEVFCGFSEGIRYSGIDTQKGELHVKGQPLGVFAVAEGLMGGEGGGSRQCGAVWKIEDVAVPVEGGGGTWFP